jgi:hypothetical protein
LDPPPPRSGGTANVFWRKKYKKGKRKKRKCEIKKCERGKKKEN